MTESFTPQAFVAKWRNTTLKEKASYQEHFIDLCRLVGHKTPVEADPIGDHFTFEAGAAKQSGGQGWADVWKKGCFALEYKGKHANLDKAYEQLLQYREALQNPPLLIVCDLDRIVIHSNFTNTVKRVVTITLDDLLTTTGMDHLRACFTNPDAFKPGQTTEQVTEEAAKQFSKLAEHLRKRGEEPARIAHFLIRLLFCLFAEDIGLLPRTLFSRMIDLGRYKPAPFNQQLRQLFAAMASGGYFGVDEIRHFNGGLFDSADALDLDVDALRILYGVSGLDWSAIEPSILGTLFERSLDPSKRKQLGAHYTSKDDILLIVEPVLMTPLRRRWETVQQQARELAQKRDESKDRGVYTRRNDELNRLLHNFADEIASVRVLDPACGSGNFLYVALRQLLDLGKAVNQFSAEVKANSLFPSASPLQLFGIEVNDYAFELAQTTVWIGWIQWLHENGFGEPSEPILKPLHNIQHMDAILAYDENGKPVEPEWPAADVIIGNPPFLGGYRIRQEFGDAYVKNLFQLYDGFVPPPADLVCYWFHRARLQVEAQKAMRVGLLATQSVRAGANRRVLDMIKETGDIFFAYSDRPWVLDGAAVRVSIVGFDKGEEQQRSLDGKSVTTINANLTTSTDLTIAKRLTVNFDLAFVGSLKTGPFDIDSQTAISMLNTAGNPNGRPNSDVVKPSVNGIDIVGRSRNRWIIDFGTEMSLDQASLYEQPFEYILKNVYPERSLNRRAARAQRWWIHGDPAPKLRRAIAKLDRYIVTVRVAKHRIFVWLQNPTLPDYKLCVIARDDDYFFGILHSRLHEVWSLATSSRHGVGNDPAYTPTTCFETFPFPWPPGKEPVDDPRVQSIAQAAQELVAKRDAWLNPPGLGEVDLKKRTLTNLYNARPTWLDLAHKKLDAAVFAAYGWPADLSDEGILVRLLALNLQRANS